MTGRVRRKAGLAAAEALTARRAAAEGPRPCGLCGRPLGDTVEWHHVVPRSEGGRATEAVHPICHRTIHATLDNADLARIGTLAALRTEPAIARFIAWVADKPADFHAPTRRGR